MFAKGRVRSISREQKRQDLDNQRMEERRAGAEIR